MRGFWNEKVFSVGNADCSWGDVALSGLLHGEWEDVVRRAEAGVSLLAAAEEAEEPPVGEDDIENAANEFRYARDLVTADEMAAWLEKWGLDTETWMSWVASDVLRARVPQEKAPASPEAEDLAAAIYAEAVCSNALGRMAYRLAERLAVAAKRAEDGTASAAGDPDAAVPGEDGLLEGVAQLGLGVAPEDARRRLRELAGLDEGFSAFRAAVARPSDVEARLRARQADWMRVRCRILQLPGEDVAREARLSIDEDGTSMEEVAADAGGEMREGTFFMEELEPALRDHVLAAQKNETVGPLKSGDGFALVVVEDKILAAADDPEIRAKAVESLVESVVSREVDNRVTWRWGK